MDSWEIRVQTDSGWSIVGEGTDSDVYIQLHGTHGSSGWKELDTRWDDFESGDDNTYYFNAYIGAFKSAQMWCGSDRWKCKHVLVKQTTGAKFSKWYNCGWIKNESKWLPW